MNETARTLRTPLCIAVTASVAIAAFLAGAAVAQGGGGKPVGKAGVVVVVPESWTSIAQRSAPSHGVVDPVVRIVTSSGRLRFGRGCNELDYVLEPTEVALIVVEWVRPTPGVTWRQRPRRFTPQNLQVRRGLLVCVRGRGGGIQFAQHGRRFAAYVLAARKASPASVSLARAVLDTLTVTKRRT